MNYFIDVDDTLVRTSGTKQIPIPQTIAWVRQVDVSQHRIFVWSRGGAEYAQTVVDRLGLSALVTACLPKPDVMVDDQPLATWTHVRELHPMALVGGAE